MIGSKMTIKFPSEFSFGMPVFESKSMMSGAYEFYDEKGRSLATGHVQYGLVKYGDTDKTARIVCSTTVYEHLRSLPTLL